MIDSFDFTLEMLEIDLEAIGEKSIETIGRDMLQKHRDRDSKQRDIKVRRKYMSLMKHPAIQGDATFSKYREAQDGRVGKLLNNYYRAANKLGEDHPYTRKKADDWQSAHDGAFFGNIGAAKHIGKRAGAYVVKDKGGSSKPGVSMLHPKDPAYSIYHDMKNQRRMKATSQLIQRADGWRKEVDPEATKAAGGKIRTKWVHHPEKELDDNTYTEHHNRNMERADTASARRCSRIHTS